MGVVDDRLESVDEEFVEKLFEEFSVPSSCHLQNQNATSGYTGHLQTDGSLQIIRAVGGDGVVPASQRMRTIRLAMSKTRHCVNPRSGQAFCAISTKRCRTNKESSEMAKSNEARDTS